MWETILGGLLAILGGWGATWYQAKNARRNRMEELTAERKILANGEAYAYTKEIASALIQADIRDVASLIAQREEWFFRSRLFLPGTFPEKWLELRNVILKLARRETSDSASPKDIESFQQRAESLAEQAIEEIYKDMNLEKIEIKRG